MQGNDDRLLFITFEVGQDRAKGLAMFAKPAERITNSNRPIYARDDAALLAFGAPSKSGFDEIGHPAMLCRYRLIMNGLPLGALDF
jgi:hypothetical protein